MREEMRQWRRTRSSHARVLEALEAAVTRHPSTMTVVPADGSPQARPQVLQLVPAPPDDDDTPTAA